jgi:hypothetical protein
MVDTATMVIFFLQKESAEGKFCMGVRIVVMRNVFAQLNVRLLSTTAPP